jgi:hypothetical protein
VPEANWFKLHMSTKRIYTSEIEDQAETYTYILIKYQELL